MHAKLHSTSQSDAQSNFYFASKDRDSISFNDGARPDISQENFTLILQTIFQRIFMKSRENNCLDAYMIIRMYLLPLKILILALHMKWSISFS